jgi:putative copper export protein/mono/diheme cytochrome c family protein
MLNGSLPPFDLAEGGIWLVLARSVTVVALLSAYGTLLFRAWVVRSAVIDRNLVRLVRASLAVQAIGLIIWLSIQTAALSDAPSWGAALSQLAPVAFDTEFGRVCLVQLLVCFGLLAVLGAGRWQVGAGIGVVSVLLQAAHSHALAMEGGISPLVLSDALHLLSAGAWLGGLVPLLLFVRAVPAAEAQKAAENFSRMATIAVIILSATALYQGWALVGSLPALIGTAYGWVALAKLGLFGVLLGCAALNRFYYVPNLTAGPTAKRGLLRSIAIETGLGLAVVCAAGFLSSLPPGLHTQPVWPFRLQPSLVTLEEDPDFRQEAVLAVLALGGAVLLLALGVVFRRVRWPGVAGAVVVAWFAVPHLDLLFVEAYPTSFYHSPSEFAATGIASASALFPAECASCHGAEGRGDGPLAASLPEPPADLTAEHLFGHTDGELFWWLGHGIEAPEGGMAMPGFADHLSEDQIWALIDYIKAHNEGLVHQSTAGWSPPVPAPNFTARCADGRSVSIRDLKGKVVQIQFLGAGEALPKPAPPQQGVDLATIVVAAEGQSLAPSGTICVADDPAIRNAYGIVAGIAPSALADKVFLLDPNGWLRDLRDAGSSLLADIEQICRHPIANPGGANAHHHHS